MVYLPQKAKEHIYLNEIVCLHYQFCNWQRMESKHRLYRVHEKANICRLSDLGITRMYGYMRSKKTVFATSPREWFLGWQAIGIDVTSTKVEELFYYDLTTLDILKNHGSEKFARLDVWAFDWDTVISRAKSSGLLPDSYKLVPPKRSLLTKMFNLYVRKTIDMALIRKYENIFFRNKMTYL